MAEVVLADVAKVFASENPAVQELSLDVADGEFLVLVGPSGCGKTTALRLIAGLESVSAGTISIGGMVVNDVPARDRDIAMVFQNYALYPHMTVAENIGFGLSLHKQDKRVIRDKVDQAARLLDLTSVLDRKPRDLSGGQQQRVAMGRAIVRDPRVFLMDEPLSNLDAQLRMQMRAQIAGLQQQLGVTTIYVTHDQVEAMTMGHRVAVMRAGRLQQVASPQVLYDDPDNAFVAGFIGTPPMTLFQARLAPDHLDLDGHSIQLPAETMVRRTSLAAAGGGQVVVGFRAEDVYLEPGEGRQPLPATVTLVEALGPSVQVSFRFAALPFEDPGSRGEVPGEAVQESDRGVVGVATLPPRTTVRVGERITAWVDTSRLYYFDARSGRAYR